MVGEVENPASAAADSADAAAMLQEPQPVKITTALRRRAACRRRHYSATSPQAQMYEGLIEFIEQTLFGLIAPSPLTPPCRAAQSGHPRYAADFAAKILA